MHCPQTRHILPYSCEAFVRLNDRMGDSRYRVKGMQPPQDQDRVEANQVMSS